MIQYCPEGSLCRVQTSRMLMKLLDLAHEALYLKKSKGRGPAPDSSGIYCEFSVSLVNIDLIQVLSTQHTLFTVNHLYRCTTKGTMAGQWSWKQTTSTYELWRKQHRRITFWTNTSIFICHQNRYRVLMKYTIRKGIHLKKFLLLLHQFIK